tara:strand:- start:11855 stop:12124 length:270 start_codon:yes stop_codon:yes gene_type:complete
MGTQVEKMQQVHQNQHDVSVRNFAQDMRATLDEKKVEVPVQEEGSEIKSADDQSRQKANQEQKNKQQNDDSQKKSGEDIDHGNRINVVV